MSGGIDRRIWDRGLDFGKTRRLLKSEYDQRAQMAAANPEMQQLYVRQGCYIGCYLTQLVNAARISEARDALELWSKSGNRIVMVRSRKKGKVMRCLICNREMSARKADKFEHQPQPDGTSVLVRIKNAREKHIAETGHTEFSEAYFDSEEKRMAIPKEIEDGDREVMAWAFATGINTGMLRVYCLKTPSLGFNTHSLRFSGITYLSALAARTGQAPETVAKISGHSDLNQLLHYQQKKAAEKMQDSVALGKHSKVEEEVHAPDESDSA